MQLSHFALRIQCTSWLQSLCDLLLQSAIFLFTFAVLHQEHFEVRSWTFQLRNPDLWVVLNTTLTMYTSSTKHQNVEERWFTWLLLCTYDKCQSRKLSGVSFHWRVHFYIISHFLIISFSVSFSGVHILQRISGCEWDDETGEVVGFNQYGYDGEDFISIDLNTETWIAPKPEAFITKLKWDADKVKMKFNQNYLTVIFPEWLKNYVAYGRSFLLRTGRITWPDVV